MVIASANGNRYKNGGPRTAVEEAFARMTRGEDVLDALIAGVNICELDPEDDSVGYGGLPNADGVVQLDASCMHGPRGARARWPRSRACARRRWWRGRCWTTPTTTCWWARARRSSRAAWASRSRTTSTPRTRAKQWLEWKRRIDPEHYLDPATREEAGRKVARQMMARGADRPASTTTAPSTATA